MANPNDIIYSRRNSLGTGFSEKTLTPVAGAAIICDLCGDLTTFTGSFGGAAITSSYSHTSSFSVSASHAPFIFDVSAYLSSSWTGSNTSQFSGTSSYTLRSLTASYALNGGGSGTGLETGSTYPITSSWAVTSSWGIESEAAQTSDFSLDSQYCLSASYASNAGLNTSYKVTGSFISYQTGNVYALTNMDNGKYVSIANTSSVQIMVSSSLDPCFTCVLFQSGSGNLVMVSENGVQISSLLNKTGSAGQFSVIKLFRLNTGKFILYGDLA